VLPGQPSTAFHKLARTAVAAGGELAYHGDFDWPGVAIAAKVIDRHGARPWRMTAGDYLSGVNASDTSVVLRGEPVPTPWEPGLGETMRATGRAIYEEAVAGQLLTDLRDASGLLEDAEAGPVGTSLTTSELNTVGGSINATHDGGPVRGRCPGPQAHAGEVAVWRVLEFIGVV
jgi:hypothetical protein